MSCAEPTAGQANAFRASRLERVFNDCFAARWRTRLYGGADEPFYRPARRPRPEHTLHYRRDYFASALHEVAHWCIAGDERRERPDFGYWYTPGDRDSDQQRAFEAVEARPQALEWMFSKACAFRFQPSADNLELAARGLLDSAGFNRRVLAEALRWQARGLPLRAGLFYRALCEEFRTARAPAELQFDPAELR